MTKKNTTLAYAEKISTCATCGEPLSTTHDVPLQCEANVELKRNGRMTRWFESEIERAQATIAKFSARLAENPVHAFEWSMDAIEASAMWDTALKLQNCFNEHGYAVTARVATQEAIRGARHPKHSTSTTSNLVSQAKAKAFAEFAATFGRELFS